MVKVDSRPTQKLLTSRFMKMNRSRNMIAIVAIIMTTVMFTSLFAAVASILKTDQQQQMRSTMSTSHIDIQDLTKKQFDEIIQYDGIQRYGHTVFMTTAENDALQDSQTEIRFADENGAESYMGLPTVGRMPEADDEAAMSTITLDLLGIPHELGSPVSLTFTLDGQQVTEEFRLSGYWRGDPLFIAQEVWLSQGFCAERVKTATAESLERGDYEGGYNLSIWCRSTLGLGRQLEKLDEQYHISKTQARISVNPAFDLFGEDGFPVGTAAVVLAVIFVSGYLIIFNVFNISVKNDIRAYGLLKNIGTTGTQLTAIVRRQALQLSLLGIPPGAVIGFFAGRAMTPLLVENASGAGADKAQVLISANPLVFLAAALFSLCTVLIACQRPCAIVARVSPIEAIRMEDADAVKPYFRRRRRTGSVTPLSMALRNLKRTWKRALAVVLSLALPVIVLNSIGSIEKGFDVDRYLDSFLSTDFNLSGSTQNLRSSNLKALTPAVKEKLAENESIAEISYVYYSEAEHLLDEKAYVRLSELIDAGEESGSLKGYGLEKERAMLESRRVVSHVTGINEAAYQKMYGEGALPAWEEFKSGDYVIVGGQSWGLGSYYDPGEKIKVEYGNGTSREYTVLATADLPFELQYPFGSGTFFYYTFYLPSEEYVSVSGNNNAMTAGIDVKEDADAEFSEWLDSYIADTEQSLYVDSRLSKAQECAAFANKYYVVLGFLGMVLLVIGIMNFFNTSAVSLLSRRREFALLEAVGMTKRQVRRMLVVEGSFYLAAAWTLANTLGVPVVWKILQGTVGQVFYFTVYVTILPSLLALPLMGAIAVLVPLYNYRRMSGETIVERI